MSEKLRVNTNPDHAGVHQDISAAVSERSGLGLWIPVIVAMMGLTLFLVLFSRFNTRVTGNAASNSAAQVSAQQRQTQDAGPAAQPNGVYQPER